MTERGQELHATADGQIAGLIDLVSTLDEAALRLPCSGREKLGDGTVAASVRHTADKYQRIAAFVQTGERMSGAHERTQIGGHRIPRYTDTIDCTAVVDQLSASRETLGRIAELTDRSTPSKQPPRDSRAWFDQPAEQCPTLSSASNRPPVMLLVDGSEAPYTSHERLARSLGTGLQTAILRPSVGLSQLRRSRSR
jgi:hypothetical protein